MHTLTGWLDWFLTASVIARALVLAGVFAVGAIIYTVITGLRTRAWSRRQSEIWAEERAAQEAKLRRQREVDESTDLVALAAICRGSDALGLHLRAPHRLQTLLEQHDPFLAQVADQSVLAAVARNVTFPMSMRRAAIARLTDQAILAKIVEDDVYAEAQTAALEHLSDPEVTKTLVDKRLRQLPAFEDPGKKDLAVLAALVGKLTDQSLLEQIALQINRRGLPPIPRACVVAAVGRITDPQVLKAICQRYAPRFSAGESQSGICEAALARISDEQLLLETADAIDQHGLGGRHMRLVRERITDQSLRAQLDRLIRDKDREAAGWRETP